MLILPWDNEACVFDREYALGGDNLLTRRIFSLPYTRQAYNDKMRNLFDDNSNDEYILDDILEYANNMCTEIDRAIYYENNTFSSYDDFIEEKQKVLAFLDYDTGRPSKLTYPYLTP